MVTKRELKKYLNKFWFIVWKDDSFKGWIISILFLFIVIKFIFFPILNLITGTTLPLAIVESCSMYHQGNLLSNFDNWYEKHDSKYSNFIINKLDFQNFIFKNGFNKGDILFVIGAKPEKLKIGDVIIFNGGSNHPIIHRIININEKNGKIFFSTIGDNNNGQLPVEEEISEDQLIGKAVFKLAPYLGWGKLIFFEFRQPENNKGFCEEN
ncbi:MAG: signal peptidase I [archaeon]